MDLIKLESSFNTNKKNYGENLKTFLDSSIINDKSIDLEYLRISYKEDKIKTLSIISEMVLRGFTFTNTFPTPVLINSIVSRHSKIIRVVENNDLYKKIDFIGLSLGNFLENYKVNSDLFFNGIYIERFKYINENLDLVYFSEILKSVGFVLVLESPLDIKEAPLKEETKTYKESTEVKVLSMKKDLETSSRSMEVKDLKKVNDLELRIEKEKVEDSRAEKLSLLESSSEPKVPIKKSSIVMLKAFNTKDINTFNLSESYLNTSILSILPLFNIETSLMLICFDFKTVRDTLNIKEDMIKYFYVSPEVKASLNDGIKQLIEKSSKVDDLLNKSKLLFSNDTLKANSKLQSLLEKFLYELNLDIIIFKSSFSKEDYYFLKSTNLATLKDCFSVVFYLDSLSSDPDTFSKFKLLLPVLNRYIKKFRRILNYIYKQYGECLVDSNNYLIDASFIFTDIEDTYYDTSIYLLSDVFQPKPLLFYDNLGLKTVRDVLLLDDEFYASISVLGKEELDETIRRLIYKEVDMSIFLKNSYMFLNLFKVKSLLNKNTFIEIFPSNIHVFDLLYQRTDYLVSLFKDKSKKINEVVEFTDMLRRRDSKILNLLKENTFYFEDRVFFETEEYKPHLGKDTLYEKTLLSSCPDKISSKNCELFSKVSCYTFLDVINLDKSEENSDILKPLKNKIKKIKNRDYRYKKIVEDKYFSQSTLLLKGLLSEEFYFEVESRGLKYLSSFVDDYQYFIDSKFKDEFLSACFKIINYEDYFTSPLEEASFLESESNTQKKEESLELNTTFDLSKEFMETKILLYVYNMKFEVLRMLKLLFIDTVEDFISSEIKKSERFLKLSPESKKSLILLYTRLLDRYNYLSLNKSNLYYNISDEYYTTPLDSVFTISKSLFVKLFSLEIYSYRDLLLEETYKSPKYNLSVEEAETLNTLSMKLKKREINIFRYSSNMYIYSSLARIKFISEDLYNLLPETYKTFNDVLSLTAPDLEVLDLKPDLKEKLMRLIIDIREKQDVILRVLPKVVALEVKTVKKDFYKKRYLATKLLVIKDLFSKTELAFLKEKKVKCFSDILSLEKVILVLEETSSNNFNYKNILNVITLIRKRSVTVYSLLDKSYFSNKILLVKESLSKNSYHILENNKLKTFFDLIKLSFTELENICSNKESSINDIFNLISVIKLQDSNIISLLSNYIVFESKPDLNLLEASAKRLFSKKESEKEEKSSSLEKDTSLKVLEKKTPKTPRESNRTKYLTETEYLDLPIDTVTALVENHYILDLSIYGYKTLRDIESIDLEDRKWLVISYDFLSKLDFLIKEIKNRNFSILNFSSSLFTGKNIDGESSYTDVYEEDYVEESVPYNDYVTLASVSENTRKSDVKVIHLIEDFVCPTKSILLNSESKYIYEDYNKSVECLFSLINGILFYTLHVKKVLKIGDILFLDSKKVFEYPFLEGGYEKKDVEKSLVKLQKHILNEKEVLSKEINSLTSQSYKKLSKAFKNRKFYQALLDKKVTGDSLKNYDVMFIQKKFDVDTFKDILYLKDSDLVKYNLTKKEEKKFLVFKRHLKQKYINIVDFIYNQRLDEVSSRSNLSNISKNIDLSDTYFSTSINALALYLDERALVNLKQLELNSVFDFVIFSFKYIPSTNRIVKYKSSIEKLIKEVREKKIDISLYERTSFLESPLSQFKEKISDSSYNILRTKNKTINDVLSKNINSYTFKKTLTENELTKLVDSIRKILNIYKKKKEKDNTYLSTVITVLSKKDILSSESIDFLLKNKIEKFRDLVFSLETKDLSTLSEDTRQNILLAKKLVEKHDIIVYSVIEKVYFNTSIDVLSSILNKEELLILKLKNITTLKKFSSYTNRINTYNDLVTGIKKKTDLKVLRNIEKTREDVLFRDDSIYRLVFKEYNTKYFSEKTR